ncbi:MAG: c-type cytochrome [Bacteroidia bacterium]|nr:c-type cytochrome [Bacteroidia bacterium]
MNKLLPTLLLSAIIISLGLPACNTSPKPAVPYESLSEEERRNVAHAIEGLELADSLEITLFASENTFLNPTNIDIDARGRVWVCEAFNYRNALNPTNPVRKEGDRILILEDTDGDGKADKETVFYQGNDVNSALGISVIGNKVIVSCSPNILVFTDENGDDKPDSKEALFSGMGGEQHDHGVHASVLGPDGKLYFNFGNAGEQLRDPAGNLITDIHGYPIEATRKPFQEGMIFRCEPDGSDLEVVAWNFRNNYEVAVDAYGSLWQSDNDDDGNKGVRINYVMEFGNYGRNDEMTGAGWQKPRTGMSDDISTRHWHQNDPGVVPNLLQTGAGSPTGILVYEGELLPKVFHNQMIHCDAGPNVVRAYPVENSGAGYKASIVDIVKGKDNWFRPSDVCVAPDGSLFISDWYDPGVGGHQMGDTLRGRIYRVAPPKSKYKVTPPDFSTPEKAAEALKSPNLATRALAWQALHGFGESAEPALSSLWNSENPRYRARALWLLTKIPGKGPEWVGKAIADGNSDIRITGLRAARQLEMDLSSLLNTLAKDENPQVRREVAVALRFYTGADKTQIWTTLAQQYPQGDRWYLEALGIASNPDPDAVYAEWAKTLGTEWDTPANRDIIWRIRAKAAIPKIGEIIASTQTAAASQRYFRAFDFHTDKSKNTVLEKLAFGQHPEQNEIGYLALRHMDYNYVKSNAKLRGVLNELLTAQKGTSGYLDLIESLSIVEKSPELVEMAVAGGSTPEAVRAAQLVRQFNKLELFRPYLNDKDEKRQIAAMVALNNAGSDPALDMIQQVISDENRNITIRRAAVQYLGRGWSGENRLVTMLKEKTLSPELEKAAATQLLSVYRKAYRELAAEVLNITQTDAALPSIENLIVQEGQPDNGKVVFGKYCQTCHQINGEGINFGPDLSEIGNKLSKSALYGAVFNPSAGISFGYEAYLFTLNDDSKLLGYIFSETDDKIDIKMMGGTVRTLAKSEIKTREMQEQSLMTEGLARAMTVQEFVDLVEYLSGLGREI